MRRVPSAVGFDGCDKNGHGTDSYATALPSPAALPALLRPSMQLLTIEAAPPHVRSEFLLYHYRPTCTTWRAAALTLFRLHNETLNIWSHLLGAAWVVAMLLETQSMAVTDEGQRFATVVFLLSALFCTAASSLYHLFGGVLSPSRYSQLYKLDINGISVVIAGSYYPGLRFAFRCHPWTYGAYAWSTLVLLFAAAYTANFEVVLVSFGLAPTLHWAWVTPAEQRLRYHGLLLLMFALYGVGFAVFFARRIPERWGRPRLALYGIGASHLWWHVCVVLAIRAWYVDCRRFATDPHDACGAAGGT